MSPSPLPTPPVWVLLPSEPACYDVAETESSAFFGEQPARDARDLEDDRAPTLYLAAEPLRAQVPDLLRVAIYLDTIESDEADVYARIVRDAIGLRTGATCPG